MAYEQNHDYSRVINTNLLFIYFVSAGNWYYMLDMCCTIELHPSPTFLMFEQWFHIFSNLYISIL